jgi:hypothetical protein
LGFDISALVASLGIGGVAIALASQGVLQDLFSYFSILLIAPSKLATLSLLAILWARLNTSELKPLGCEV